MNATQHFRIVGMTCTHCVQAVTSEVKAIDDVLDVEIQLVAGGTSTATISSSRPLSTAQVAEAVEEAGYALAGPRDLPLV